MLGKIDETRQLRTVEKGKLTIINGENLENFPSKCEINVMKIL
jgi:hypothetical protein